MPCDDCTASRRYPDHPRYDLNCIWCGARYAMTVRSKQGYFQFPVTVADQEMTRRQWFDHVVKTWADWGHDKEQLLKLAAAERVPLEPVTGRAHGGKT